MEPNLTGDSSSERAAQAAKPRGRRLRWLAAGAVVLIALAVGGSRTAPGRAIVKTYLPWLAPAEPIAVRQTEAELPASTFDCSDAPMPWIEPGTIVDEGPPQGWSHLVIKNGTQVVAGQTGEAAATWNKMAEMFQLALMADAVRAAEGGYYLARVGIGWCHPIGGHDRVVSAKTQVALGAKLGPLDSLSLAMREVDCDDHVRVRGRSRTTLFYDVDRPMAYGTKHRRGQLRHALLVHPTRGELEAFLWIVPAADAAPGEPHPERERTIERLAPNFVTTFPLAFQPQSGSLVSMPAASDYAVTGIPVGRESLPVDAFLPEAHSTALDQASAAALERKLRDALGW